MPSTVVNVAVGALIAAGLLGPAFDGRAVVIVLAAAGFPDLDAVVAVVLASAHNALFHTVLIPLAAGALLYLDTAGREPFSVGPVGPVGFGPISVGPVSLGAVSVGPYAFGPILPGPSRIRSRYGSYGVQVAWVAILAYAVAGIGLDLFNIEAANPLYPVHDQFYSIVGKIDITNTQGFVQTFVEIDPEGERLVRIGRQRGATGEFAVPSPFRSEGRRLFVIVESGWQALLVLTGAVVLVAKWTLTPASRRQQEASTD